MRITRYLFLATVFCVTFEKVHWNVAGTVSLADILAVGFLVAWAVERLGTHDWRLPRTSAIVACFGLAFLLSYLIGYYSIDTADASGQFGKGMLKWAIHILFLVAAIAYLSRRSERFYWQTIGTFTAGIVVNAVYGVLQLVAAQGGRNLDNAVLSPLTGGASSINIYGAVAGQSVYRPNALTGDPNHLGIMLIVPILVLLPVYFRLGARPPAAHAARGRARLPVRGRAGDAVAERPARARASALLVLAVPYRRWLVSRDLLVPLAGGARARRDRRPLAARLLRDRDPLALPDGRQLDVGALRRLRLHPERAGRTPAVRARVQHVLGLLRDGHRQDELGAALVLRRAARRDRAGRDGRVRRLPLVPVPPPAATRGRRDGRWRRSATRPRRGCGRSPGG